MECARYQSASAVVGVRPDVELPLDIYEAVPVGIEHREQILSLLVGDLQLQYLLDCLLKLLSCQCLLVEDIILEVVNVGEEILEEVEAVRGAGVCAQLAVLLVEAAVEADHHDEDAEADQQEPVLVLLDLVEQVHAEDAGHHGARGHDEGPHLDEEAQLDDLVPDAVQVGGDELVRILQQTCKRCLTGQGFNSHKSPYYTTEEKIIVAAFSNC